MNCGKGLLLFWNFSEVWGSLGKVGSPDFKWVIVGCKTFYTMFIGHAQNSAAYRYLSLKDHFICESSDAKSIEHIFLKKCTKWYAK